MAFLSKYGAARHIYVPVVKRAVVDFAVSADWTPAAGDVKISKDGGAAANVTNLPTAITMGNTAMWDFSITATEMQAAQVMVTVADAATKAVEDQMFIIETYGDASSQLPNIPGPAVGASGGHIVAGTGANQLSLDGSGRGAADVTAWRGGVPDALIAGLPPTHAAELGAQAKADSNLFRKNVAVAKYAFKMVDATDLFTPETGLTVTCTRSLDGAAFANCATATATELASGWYYVALATTDLNANVVILRMTATGAHPHELVAYPTP